MKKSTGCIDKNGIEVFLGDKLYCHTMDCNGIVIEIDGKFFIQFEDGIIEWVPEILNKFDMEVV